MVRITDRVGHTLTELTETFGIALFTSGLCVGHRCGRFDLPVGVRGWDYPCGRLPARPSVNARPGPNHCNINSPFEKGWCNYPDGEKCFLKQSQMNPSDIQSLLARVERPSPSILSVYLNVDQSRQVNLNHGFETQLKDMMASVRTSLHDAGYARDYFGITSLTSQGLVRTRDRSYRCMDGRAFCGCADCDSGTGGRIRAQQ
jgi:hypothetical protein